MKKKQLSPPAHLKGQSRAMWLSILDDYTIEDSAGLSLLSAACTAHQRAEAARKQIEKEGQTIADRFGQMRPHPCAAIERDATNQLIAALRALKLGPGDAS